MINVVTCDCGFDNLLVGLELFSSCCLIVKVTEYAKAGAVVAVFNSMSSSTVSQPLNGGGNKTCNISRRPLAPNEFQSGWTFSDTFPSPAGKTESSTA